MVYMECIYRYIDKEISYKKMKAQLEAIKEGKSNAYDHLVDVLRQVVLNNDRDAYHLFEYYSLNAKNDHHPHHQYSRPLYTPEHIQITKKFLNKINVGSEEEPAEPGPCGFVPNLIDQAKWFEKAGVGFGEECTYLLFKSLQKFSITKQIKELKFWGKIIGSENDYFIAEGSAEGGEEGQLPADVEPKGTGVNKQAYWVCSNLINGDWKQLPLVNPSQMTVARKIKYNFTGNLDAEIYTNPFFKGKEAHLLKCQIVRINFACTIVPRTMFNVNAEDKKQIEPANQEWKLPGFSFLANQENWVHHPQNILKNGRLTLQKPNIPEGVEVDEEKLMKQLEAQDPLEERLKSISKDEFKKGVSGWALKVVGDSNEYRAMTKNKDYVNYGFICIKSLIWKGWTLVYHNKQWSSVYIGSGAKSNVGWFFPKEPEIVLTENSDRNEQPEPNFPAEEKKLEGEVLEIPKQE